MSRDVLKSQDWFLNAIRSANVKSKQIYAKKINQTPTFNASERMGIYRNAYRIRLKECLAEDFPVTAKLMGSKKFDRISEDYIRLRPSRYSSLVDFGENFAKFLRNKRALSKIFSELADYEWAIIDCRFTENRPKNLLKPDQLAELSPEEIMVERDPSVFAMESSWPLIQVWRKKRQLPKKKSFLIVHRRDRSIQFCSLDAHAYKIVSYLTQPTSLIAVLSDKTFKNFDAKIWNRTFKTLVKNEIVFYRHKNFSIL